MRTPVQRWRRSVSTRAASSGEVLRGERCGREERSAKATIPPWRKRRTHFAALCRLSLNSAAAKFKLELALQDSPGQLLSTVNREASIMVVVHSVS